MRIYATHGELSAPAVASRSSRRLVTFSIAPAHLVSCVVGAMRWLPVRRSWRVVTISALHRTVRVAVVISR